ncbi:MAG: signal peptidase I [Ruminococcaceae bacterium]|nr:signal peptidase I [Oscillospiraceae bacterium]
MMKAKKIASKILTVFIILLSLFLITVSLAPKMSGYNGYYVISDSMSPAINKGDLVFTKEVEFADVEVGDVLTFKKKGNDRWFSHRVVKINTEEKSFRTKGDHNNVEDPGYTSYDVVVGRVEKKVPFIGYFPFMLSTLWGKISLVAIYVFYFAFEIDNATLKKLRKKEG